MLTRYPLTIRFIEGEEGGGAAGGDEQPGIEPGEQTAPEQQSQGQQSQGNPAWESLRSELDPITFSKIEPHLKKWETDAQKRIESINSQFAPFQPHVAGRDPETVGKALAYADALEKDPAQVYQMLGSFLQQTGRLPSMQEAEEQLADNDDDQPTTDPRLEQLAQQQEKMIEFLQTQQRLEEERQAEQELGTVISGLQTAHPELSKEDLNEIISRAAFAAQQNPGKDIDFAKAINGAYDEFNALKNRILSTPRPGDSAPQLPPISGGAPAGQQPKSWGQLSNGEVQDFIAGALSQNKG